MRLVAAAVVGVLAAATVAGADLRHYSWIVYAQTLMYALLWAGGHGDLVAATVLLQQGGVILAVFAMSALECTLLQEAADAYGLGYIPLNFALHQAPLLLVLATWGGAASEPRQQAATAACVWLAYVLSHPHMSDYGCPIDTTSITAGSILIIVTFWAAAQWYSLTFAPCGNGPPWPSTSRQPRPSPQPVSPRHHPPPAPKTVVYL